MGEEWSLNNSFNYCERKAKRHYENFPVGSWLIPRDKRKYVYSIYAFARTADDFADESYSAEQRLPLLDEWERQLESCYENEASHPIFVALKETVRRFTIPIEPFKALLKAFRMDVMVKRYNTFLDLLYYCQHSANPIGQLILYLFDYREPEFHRLSDCICTALQLTNFWQDVAIDLKKDRIYLPLDDMARYGYMEEELFAHKVNGPFKNLLVQEIDLTRELFKKGQPLLSQVSGRLHLELRLTWLCGMRVLELIEAADYDVFNKRPTMSALNRIRLFFALFGSSFKPAHDSS